MERTLQQLFNRCDSPTLEDICEEEQDLDIELGPFIVQEVNDAITKLKNGRSPGDDNAHAEMLKAEDQEMPLLLQNILQDVWENKVIPDAWKRGTIIKFPKNGNLSKYNNWIGVTLLSITSKVFCLIILQRITTAVDYKLLHQKLAGFKNGKSCIDYIFSTRHILEQSREWDCSLYMVFDGL